MANELGAVGVWSTELHFGEPDEAAATAAELEELEYAAIWYPGAFGGPVFDMGATLLGATQRIPVALGVLNLWKHAPAEVVAGFSRLDDVAPGRFILGIGSSHASMVNTEEQADLYRRPFRAMTNYLNALDEAGSAIPQKRRVLAALGPKMLKTAKERAAGVHPYFVTAEHTRRARESLGGDALLAPEHAVVLEQQATRAREIARKYTGAYLGFPNYCRNLLRLGWKEEDFLDGGSDQLVDALVAWGKPEEIRKKVYSHHEAGADHVCIQVIGENWGQMPPEFPRREWRELAAALVA
ncbi:hypothetical protein BST20_07015 [Mycobacterium branderi]|uniref:Luciferase-like domain-containing protein n=1 Tax=Mycobacterium branderi TaxID=43348 RepID=A0AA91LZX9_9MYCO|nr:TIGR03620 family F420-dependent LLM class oxidoreductase [Mycobacterium branderi]ORA40460.1 hypothetical protein BST20_07015 [Mycobacterium branderi]